MHVPLQFFSICFWLFSFKWKSKAYELASFSAFCISLSKITVKCFIHALKHWTQSQRIFLHRFTFIFVTSNIKEQASFKKQPPQVFFKMLENSQENKVTGLSLQILLKKWARHRCFSNTTHFSEHHPFYRARTTAIVFSSFHLKSLAFPFTFMTIQQK